MNFQNKDYEKLSAYIDGELSPQEVLEIEQKIKLSKDLQKKLAELNKIKQLTASSIKQIPESPYFETKLMAGLNAGNPFAVKIKKWMPALSIAAVTIALMLFLKYNPKVIDNLVEEQKTNIAGFYKENLKPLLITAGLTNEDIFNFAFYRQLPLDKSNSQFLKLGSSVDGKEYFEIKTTSLAGEEDNFNKFVKALNLNTKQKLQIDSILESYADEMQSQVLVNDNNTVAINPNLWNYNKAIFADIMAFAEDANKVEFAKIVPAGYSFYDKPTVARIVREIKSKKENEYIFFTPDTIFTEEFFFEKEKFEEEMKQMEKDINRDMKEAQRELKKLNITLKLDSNFVKLKHDSSWNHNFKVYFDSNSCHVQLSKIIIPKIELPDFDSIAHHIEEATKNLNFSFKMPDIPKIIGDYKIKVYTDDSLNNYNYDFRIPNIDSLIKFETRVNDSLLKNYKFNFHLDSLTSKLQFFKEDSLFFFDQKELNENMQELEKEMERFREEMEKFREEFTDSVKRKEKESI